MSGYFLVGAGSIGGLVATQLSKAASRPVTLIMNNEARLTSFLNSGSSIRYKNLIKGRNPIIADFEFKAVSGPPRDYNGQLERISNLLVTTKSHQTLSALEKIIPSLDESSNVVLIQNGVGVYDKILDKFYPGRVQVPNFYQGVISHGVFRRQNEINHVGLGDLKLCKLNKDLDSSPPQIVQDLITCDILNLEFLDRDVLLLYQYEKLIVNACINTLTAVLDVTNGELLRTYQLEPLCNGIIRELVQVLLLGLPESLKSNPTLARVLDRERLLAVVRLVIKSTEHNSSSMREDIRSLRKTEVDDINGYIYKLAKQYNIFVPYNKMAIDLVKLKLQLNENRNDWAIKLAA